MCKYCDISIGNIFTQNKLSVTVLYDKPEANFHCITFPRRHVTSYLELTSEELQAIFDSMNGANIKIRQDITIVQHKYIIKEYEHVHIHMIPVEDTNE